MKEAQEIVLRFLAENRNLIEQEDLDSLYKSAQINLEQRQIPIITYFFIKSGINPLDYLNDIPTNYARGLSIVGREIDVPGNIRTIGTNAFIACMQIENIILPNNITDVFAGAFMGCKKLKHINWPNKCDVIPSECFRMCAELPKIEIPEGVTQILDAAFAGCKALKEVHLPKSLLLVGAAAFRDCPSEIYYNGTIEDWKNVRIIMNPFSVHTVHCIDGDAKAW